MPGATERLCAFPARANLGEPPPRLAGRLVPILPLLVLRAALQVGPGDRFPAAPGAIRMIGELQRIRIRRVDAPITALRVVQRSRIVGPTPEKGLHDLDREAVKLRAVAGKMELVGRVAEQRVTKQIGRFRGTHTRLRPERDSSKRRRRFDERVEG